MVDFLSSVFDPKNFAGVTGLLDRMSPAMSFTTQQSPGFLPPQTVTPAPQGGVMDANAMLPENAMPTSGIAPMGLVPQAPPAPSSGGAMNFLGGVQDKINDNSNMLLGLAAGIAGGKNWGDGLSKGMTLAMTGGQLDTQQGNRNRTQQFLLSKGMDPEMARTVASNPVMLRSVLPRLMGASDVGQTDDIKEYQFAKREDPSLTFEKFMQRKKSVSGEFSLTPQYGTDKDGNTVLIQTGKSGEAIQTKLPEGVKISSGVEKIDLGTSWGIVDKRTGNLVGTQAKDIEGEKVAEKRGEARGQAQVALPNAIANAEQTLKIIQDVKNDPSLQRGTGASSMFNFIPATGGFDFAQKVEQLKGKAFLEAFQNLKGGGAITEMEGRKAENAIARLNVAQSEGAFLQALNDLEEVVTSGIGRAKARAGVGGSPRATPPQSVPVAQNDPLGLR